MTKTITIDWLSFTTRENVEDEALLLLLDYGRAISEAPRFGYTSALRFASGLVVMSNSDRSEMGRHWILSGACLKAIADETGMDGFRLLRAVFEAGAKITRLDLAKDARDEGIEIPKIYRALSIGSYTGQIRSYSQIESSGGGHTIYLGSRASEKFARIYDKGVEAGEGGDWKRFEVELKGDVAKEAGRALVDPRNTPAQIFDGITRAMAVIATPHYTRFWGEAEPVSLPKIAKEADRERWIAEQVTKAVLEHVHEFPDSNAVLVLYRALKNVIDGE